MPKATVAAIVTVKDKNTTMVLLTRRNVEPFKDQWCLPGGHIDEGESVRTAIIREIKEETNLDFDAQFFGYFDEIVPKQNIHAVVIVFEGRGIGTLKTQIREVAEARWVSIVEARSLPLAFTHSEILDTYASRHVNHPGALEEYVALKDEIKQRINSRDQLLVFAIVTAGTVLGLAVQFHIEPSVILAYPVLATLLVIAWVHDDIRIGQLGRYIREKIEPQFEGMGWEEYLRLEYAKRENRLLGHLVQFSAGGIFLTAELLPMSLATYDSRMVFSGANIVLLALDIIGLALTFYLALLRKGRVHPKGTTKN